MRDTALRLTPIIWATKSWVSGSVFASDKSCIRKSQRANRDSAE